VKHAHDIKKIHLTAKKLSKFIYETWRCNSTKLALIVNCVTVLQLARDFVQDCKKRISSRSVQSSSESHVIDHLVEEVVHHSTILSQCNAANAALQPPGDASVGCIFLSLVSGCAICDSWMKPSTITYSWRRGSVVRTTVFDWRTFHDLHLIYGWHVTTSWLKCPLWVNQPGQLTLLSLRIGKWVTWIAGMETIKR